MIDSHAHLQFSPLYEQLDDVVARASEVKRIICVSTHTDQRTRIESIHKRYPHILGSVGIHPHEKEGDYSVIDEAAKKPYIVAIGETGLDYYYDTVAPDVQRKRFISHIERAIKYDLPLIIHARDAEEDIVSILRDYPQARGVIHCFTGSSTFAEEVLSLEFYISFSGIITFKNAAELQSIAKNIPLDRLLIETDAPYLAPTPYRGKTNEPAYVYHVAQTLATLRDIPLPNLITATTDNTYNLFRRLC